MGLKNLFPLIFWLVSVSLIVVVSSQVCLDSFGTFKPGDTYDKNLQIILSSLASEVITKDGFFNTSIGTDPEKVHAMGMCIPGAKQQFCFHCIKNTTDKLLQTCPNQSAAFHWSGGGETLCMIRYSNWPSFTPVDLDLSSTGSTIGDLETNLTASDGLLVRMVNVASSSSGKDVSVSNNRYYVADEAALPSSQMLYALMQCTPDVSPSNCKTCLRQSVDAYQRCCRGKQGGYVYSPNCIYRWDLYRFSGAFGLLNLEPQLQSPPPPWSYKRTIIGIVVTVLIMALLALGLAICRRTKNYQAFTLSITFFTLQSGFVPADDITSGYLRFDIKEIVSGASLYDVDPTISRQLSTRPDTCLLIYGRTDINPQPNYYS